MKFTERRKQLFLEALRDTAMVNRAAKAAGVSKRTAYYHRRSDPDFGEEWADAVEEATGALEDEARRRAERGVSEPVYYQGQKVGTIQRYSDSLLMFLLRALRPGKYRERLSVHHVADPAIDVGVARQALLEKLTHLEESGPDGEGA